MRTLLCITLFTLAIASSAAQEGANDKDKMQGTWTIISGTKDGKEMPADEIKGVKIVFDGDKVIVKAGGKDEEAKFKLDAGKKPKEIDVIVGNGQSLPGIYDLDGDNLKIALGGKADKRPQDFKSDEAKKSMLVLMRDKAEKK